MKNDSRTSCDLLFILLDQLMHGRLHYNLIAHQWLQDLIVNFRAFYKVPILISQSAILEKIESLLIKSLSLTGIFRQLFDDVVVNNNSNARLAIANSWNVFLESFGSSLDGHDKLFLALPQFALRLLAFLICNNF